MSRSFLYQMKIETFIINIKHNPNFKIKTFDHNVRFKVNNDVIQNIFSSIFFRWNFPRAIKVNHFTVVQIFIALCFLVIGVLYPLVKMITSLLQDGNLE